MTDSRLRPNGLVREVDPVDSPRPREEFTLAESRLIVGVVIGMMIGLAGTVLVALAWWLGGCG